jgi:SRSO17 transposase
MVDDWRDDLEAWLKPFLAALRHKTRGRMCPAYVAGLIGPGDRKSVQPMASRDAAVSYDQLHHFVASGSGMPPPWKLPCWPKPTLRLGVTMPG